MSFISLSQRIFTTAVALAIMLALVGPASADTESRPVLTLRISDTTATEGAENAWFSVYFQNWDDTLAGFSMMVYLNRIDMIEFKADSEDTLIDTTWQYCIDWENGQCIEWADTTIVDTAIVSSAFDTTGSLISGWQYVSARPVEGSMHSIKVTALADKMGPPYKPGLPPQSGEGLLYRLKVRVYDSLNDGPDSIPLPDSIHLQIVDDCGETSFSDPSGEHLIGTITDYSICDTTFLECVQWNGEICEDWDTIDNIEGADSLVIDTFWVYWYCAERNLNDSCIQWIDTLEQDAESIWIYNKPWTRRDTLVSFYHNGKLVVEPSTPCLCGDVNNDGSVNVGDVVFLSNFIFHQGPAPLYYDCADCNHNDGLVNVGDAVYLVQHIFKSGPAPDCTGP